MQKKIYLFFLASIIISMGVVSASPAALSVYPSTITDQSVGSTFTVQVKLEEVSNLIGLQFSLGYDTKILDIVKVDITIPDVWKDNYHQTKDQIDEASGAYHFAGVSLNPVVPFDGTTTIATVTFKVMGGGKCTLNLYDSLLSDLSIQQIPHDVNDGHFDNTGVKGSVGTAQDSGQAISVIAVVVVVVVLFGVYKFMVKKKKK